MIDPLKPAHSETQETRQKKARGSDLPRNTAIEEVGVLTPLRYHNKSDWYVYRGRYT